MSADKERIMKIISTLEAFDGVVTACFSKQLIGDYKAAIAPSPRPTWSFTQSTR